MTDGRMRRALLWFGIPIGAVVLVAAGIALATRGETAAVADTIAAGGQTTAVPTTMDNPVWA